MEQQFSRIAVKVGSNVLTRRDGTLDVTRMSALVDQIAELHKTGVEVILVSSGAVASGRSEVHSAKKLDSVDQRQLFSAVGQAKLINRYYELLSRTWYSCWSSADYEREFCYPQTLSQSKELHDGDVREWSDSHRQ